jgi:hypothetical protein
MTDKLPYVERLTGENYTSWAIYVKNHLLAKGLWDVVKGNEENSKTDQKALAEIIMGIGDRELLFLAAEATTAKDLWNALEEDYKRKLKSRVPSLKRALNGLNKAPSETIQQYVSRAKGFRRQLKSAGHIITDEELTSQILDGLPAEFEALIAGMEGNTTPVPLEDAICMLLRREEKINTKATAAAYTVQGRQGSGRGGGTAGAGRSTQGRPAGGTE